jgi:hypothetical protein
MNTFQGGEGDDIPVEATEADIAEQQTPVDPGANGDDTAASPPASDVEASEGDRVDQAIAVPWDEDDQR